MKNVGSITQYFDGISEIFNPAVAYQGNYAFSADVFSMVSKKQNGKNLVEEYYEKKFYSQIRTILNKMKFTNNPRLFVVSDLAGNYGRELKMSIELFIIEFAHILTGSSIEFSGNDETIKDEAVQFFRNYRKQLSEIQNGNINSENESINLHLKTDYQLNEEHRKKVMGRDYRPISYQRYLEVKKDYITNFIVGLRYLVPMFDKPIKLEELQECLDLEKFYLAMAKQLIDVTHTTLKSDNAVHNSFVYVEKYIMAVKALREKGTYSVSINTISLDGRNIKYSVDDAVREYNEIKVAHPEFSVYHFEADGRDYRDMDTVRDFTSEMEEYIESKKLEASWNFIRNGKKEITPVDEDTVIRLKNKKTDKKKVTREEKLQAITDRMGFLDHTNYVYKMTGKDQFEGYIGYIYSNGVVVFEKFYKSIDNHEPSTSNATYVMNFNNFVQMSKLTKTDIMAYIKNGGTDVRRVYHTNKWVDKMIAIITGKTYDEKAMEKIDRLISEGKISKKKK